MFTAISILLTAVILPLVWHHRRQYDQRLHCSQQLITQVLVQFREYQTQRNRAKFLADQRSEVSVNLQIHWAQVTHSLHQFSLWTQPWFTVSAGSLRRLQHQIAVTAVAWHRDPHRSMDWQEALLEADFYTIVTHIRQQLLRYSYLRYIRETL